MTNSTEEASQELDDILLDDLVEVQERTQGASEPTLTPSQNVYNEQRQNIVEAEISRISDKLDISESTQHMAASLFEQYVDKEDITGNALEVLAASCLYTACKVDSVPLSPDDFANVPDTAFTRVLLLRRVKSISSTLGLDPRAFFDPTQYVDHYCEDLGLDDEVAERAHEILNIADEAGIGGGKSPTGRAAAAIYNACLDLDREVTQTAIGNASDVTEVTIRNRYQDQRELLTSSTTSSESKSDSGPEEEPTQALSIDDSSASVIESSFYEVSDFEFYVGEAVAENLTLALRQIEEADEALVDSCADICKRAKESGGFDELEADDASLALAIIRQASMDLGTEISYPKLKRTLEEQEGTIHWLTKNLAETI